MLFLSSKVSQEFVRLAFPGAHVTPVTVYGAYGQRQPALALTFDDPAAEREARARVAEGEKAGERAKQK